MGGLFFPSRWETKIRILKFKVLWFVLLVENTVEHRQRAHCQSLYFSFHLVNCSLTHSFVLSAEEVALSLSLFVQGVGAP